MESLIWFSSAAVFLIRLLCVTAGFFALVTGVSLLVSARSLLKEARILCPVTGNATPVLLKIHTLKDPQRLEEGVDVVRCPHFGSGEVLCPKGCAFDRTAQQIYQAERERHFKKNGILVF